MLSGWNSAKLSAQSPPCSKNPFPSTTSASCSFKCLVSPANTKGGKLLIFSTFLSAAFWIIESVVVYFVLLAFDVDILEFTTIIATYTSSIILGVASFLPMGIGVTEGSLAGFFALKGVDISLALTIVIFIRIFTRWIGVGLGFILLKIIGGFSIESEKEN